MSADAQEIVEDGAEGVEEQGVVDYSRGVIFGGGITALGLTIVEIIIGIPGTFLAPVRAFAGGIATFIGGTLGAPVIITDAGAATAAASFASGTAALLGPLAFPVAVIVSAGGVYVFILFLRRISVSPTQIFLERDG